MIASIKALKAELQGPRGLTHRARKQFIPAGEVLAQQAWKQVSFAGRELTSEEVQANFNSYLCELVDTEYQIYLGYEERCINQGVLRLALDSSVGLEFPNVHGLIKDVLEAIRDPTLEDIKKFSEVATMIRPFYKLVEQSFAQGRMTRAGGSSQYHLQRLLELAGYGSEFETQRVLNGTVDFLFPSLEAWQRDRRRCVVVSIKRSLRERYKQVFEELGITRGMTVYLLVTQTYGEARRDITKPKVRRLDEQNVYLVVRDEVKKKRFPKESNVIGFTAFINEELPYRRAQWSPLFRPTS